MKKRILALLLTLAMLLTIVPAAVLADDAEGAAAGTAAASENPFTDMTNGSAYYYKPVFWAVDNGITTGKTSTSFAPENLCTRGQVVTFLYRAAGSPKVSGSNPFEDVQAGSYYYNAVLWAVANGITTGKDETHFGPDLMCTRGQVVTFMYRAADSPKVSASNPFTDVTEDSYCYDAVLWAVKNGITSGKTATTFAPNEGCTRAQVVTFLYRGAGSPAVDAPEPYVYKPPVGSAVSKADAVVGKYVSFGSYEQDNNTANGKELIEWRVLKVENGKAMLISRYLLDGKPYSTTSNTAWNACTLRTWLNSTFYNTAFTAAQQAQIQTTTVSPPAYSNYTGVTQDKVFVLSMDEVYDLLKSDKARSAANTAYAEAQGSNGFWWMRTTSASYGSDYVYGTSTWHDTVGTQSDIMGVRPVIWVTLS